MRFKLMLKDYVKTHLKDNKWQYLLIGSVLLLGIIIGNFKVESLEGGVKEYLVNLIDNYLKVGLAEHSGFNILPSAFMNQAKTILLIWFLGLTVIGFPLILAVVFLKGFSLGFTISFLIQEKAAAGIIIALVSIAPQNIIYIPILLVWAVMAINFSINIVKGKENNKVSFGARLITYSILLFIFLILIFIGAFIESYLSPWLLSLLI
ncbi:Stage II sporulation protein M (SpoIIM) [Candidatus Syntrophocurvum alkaliphilum]|uniref:Stage II sporulation protein M (SpoIIM) n=1 Tax=Candidatus Syntrophocurvum alkaliphilum TaxID=2293317 RepID=A0A6I6DEM8_9FIRM|nr:stage II sporulation protein M [Candidatus Syntrophocurvum alkaliphilum]QGT98988.1 Stage II sporulation protein M (SpoIIM) [Candidatus Syntrophocurvum alkaliphilum]